MLEIIKTTDVQDYYNVKKAVDVKTTTGETVQIFEDKGRFLLEDLRGRKKLLEVTKKEIEEEIAEITAILADIDNKKAIDIGDQKIIK